MCAPDAVDAPVVVVSGKGVVMFLVVVVVVLLLWWWLLVGGEWCFCSGGWRAVFDLWDTGVFFFTTIQYILLFLFLQQQQHECNERRSYPKMASER